MTRAEKITLAIKMAGGGHPAHQQRYNLPCVHEEAVVEWCTTCTGAPAEWNHIRSCAVHDRATRGANKAGLASCVTCPDYQPETPEFSPDTSLRFDEFNLYPNLPGRRFNPSLIRYNNRLVFIWRNGWAGSDLYACRLTEKLQPDGLATKLEIRHPACSYGREDPRLFIHNDKLHVSFTGVTARHGHTNVLYAELGDDLQVRSVRFPQISGRRDWEKNFGFFSWKGEIYAVYTIAPHRILRIQGERTTWAYQTDNPVNWGGGEPHGGAAPVRVGDEFWSFAHDRVPGMNGKQRYRTIVYSFASEPPFRPERWIPRPIVVADPRTNPDNYSDVIWSGGVCLFGDLWLLANGHHDRFCSIDAMRHDELNSRLIPISD